MRGEKRSASFFFYLFFRYERGDLITAYEEAAKLILS